MKISFCFGNGESRHGIDLDQLNEYGPVYGCNAIYRDWHVDNLIVTNRRLMREITASKEHQQTNLYVPPGWRRSYEKYPEIRYLSTLPGLGDDANRSSGASAISLACEHQANIVVMFGYDLWARNGELNNIYKDTQGYPGSEDRPRDPAEWQAQMVKIFLACPHVQFVQVQADDWIVPAAWADCANFSLDSRQNLFYVLENMDRI